MLLCLGKQTLLLTLIICLQLLHVAQSQYRDNANLLCTQMLNTQLLERCCGDLKPSNLPFVQSKCEQYKDDFGACRYECIFNHWHLLHRNNSLIMSNVRSMVDQLYPRESGFNSYSVMLLESFEHCDSLSSTYTGMMRMYATLPDPETGVNSAGFKCNKNAMLYAKCTIANMFLNCPSDFWQESLEDCAASRRLLSHCVRFLDGMDDVNSRGKLRSHSSSASHNLKIRSLQPSTHWYTAFINWLVF
ncbi:uncharacterized protein LOC117784190 [Drosophila innubila]|uniref:uncharacterized protein LOC117784190 n=1 Tax=Drosophila innubila TaxID=198719 RepID=UPI00148BE3DB|nr:uncharacterized protein LOC117784190 [Drosophila innubila]